MKRLEIELWALVEEKISKIVSLQNIFYIYEVRAEIIEKLLKIKYYKENPCFMPLDKEYSKEFKLLKTNENIKNIDNYNILNMDVGIVILDNVLI